MKQGIKKCPNVVADRIHSSILTNSSNFEIIVIIGDKNIKKYLWHNNNNNKYLWHNLHIALLSWLPISKKFYRHIFMMTSSNGNIFRVTGIIVRGIHRWPVNSPRKGQWRGAVMFSLICALNKGWVNNREGGDFRRHRAHYDVNVMLENGRSKSAQFVATIQTQIFSENRYTSSLHWNSFIICQTSTKYYRLTILSNCISQSSK